MDNKNIQNMIDNGIAINSETGEFDLSVLPKKEQERIKKYAAQFLKKEAVITQPKKKVRVKKPKTYGKNKKKK